MDFIKVQHDGDSNAYAILRNGDGPPGAWLRDDFPKPILKSGAHARRFDCSPAYHPALAAVKAGDLEEARRIITEAGVFESNERPPDWCYER